MAALFVKLKEPLPPQLAPAAGVKILPDGPAHDLQLLRDGGGLHQCARHVLGGHDVLHDPRPILPGIHGGIGVHEIHIK